MYLLFELETIEVSKIIICWLIFEKTNISILAGNLNLGLSYLITTVSRRQDMIYLIVDKFGKNDVYG
jgi:hypothetical protein